jgi:hypothetical protein
MRMPVMASIIRASVSMRGSVSMSVSAAAASEAAGLKSQEHAWGGVRSGCGRDVAWRCAADSAASARAIWLRVGAPLISSRSFDVVLATRR